jgi:hypothetical protein
MAPRWVQGDLRCRVGFGVGHGILVICSIGLHLGHALALRIWSFSCRIHFRVVDLLFLGLKHVLHFVRGHLHFVLTLLSLLGALRVFAAGYAVRLLRRPKDR